MSPDTRHHRGAHPADPKLFGPDQLRKLRRAVTELSWLLSRGYNMTSSLKLVGDRHGLRERQRSGSTSLVMFRPGQAKTKGSLRFGRAITQPARDRRRV